MFLQRGLNFFLNQIKIRKKKKKGFYCKIGSIFLVIYYDIYKNEKKPQKI